MDGSKYIIEDDNELNEAGFSNMSKYDKEAERIYDELDKYSDKSFNDDNMAGPIGVLIIQSVFFGLHRIMNGKIFSGLLYGITLGGFGIWLIIDWIIIFSGNFTDKYGKPINPMAVYKLGAELNELEKRHANGRYY